MTQDRFFVFRPATCLVAGFLLAMASAGCSSPGPARSGGPSLAAASAPRPVAMQGDGRFFDGQVVATVSISRGFERGGPRGRDGRPKDEYEQIDLPDTTDKDYAESISKIMMLQLRGSPMPPMTLRLNLANRTKQALEVGILELNSDLGNFAVQPDRLILAAGQAAEPEAMTSQLGIMGDNLPVKIALRIGDKTESQIITVHSLFTPEGTRK